MRLIDADRLMETIEQHQYMLVDRINSKDYGMFTIGIQQATEEQPTAYELKKCSNEFHISKAR